MAFPDIPSDVERKINSQIAAEQQSEDTARRAGALTKNPNYQVIIKREASKTLRGLEIRANLPETFSFGVSANYSSNLPSSLSEILQNSGSKWLNGAGQILGAANNVAKVNPILQELTHQVWQGSTPISFSIPLLFDAVSNAEEDVVAPIRDLMALALPYRDNPDDPYLRPPGPDLIDQNHGRISLRIGNMNYFHSVLLKDVSASFSSRFTKSGAPIAAECDVSFETINTPVQDDIDLFFLYSSRYVSNSERQTYGTTAKAGDRVSNIFQKTVDALKNPQDLLLNTLPITGVSTAINAGANSARALFSPSPSDVGDFP